jgi:hypothetical protein
VFGKEVVVLSAVGSLFVNFLGGSLGSLGGG